MKRSVLLPKLGIILLLILGFASCEEDFSNLETEIIEQNFSTDVDSSKTVIAYSLPFSGVQTNGLPLYQVGTYTDPFYGKTTVNLLSQLSLGSIDTDPDFGDCPVLDSVVIYLPFFSESETVDDVTTYTLDSIFGSEPINIQMFESNYFLSQNDPNTSFEDPQNYYSNQRNLFESNLGTLITTIEDFTPKAEAIVLNDTVTLPPGLRVSLPVEFFQEKIMDMGGSTELLNNNNFREYFRGIYFKTQSAAGNGNLTFFNFENTDNPPGITLYYTSTNLVSGETCEDFDSDTFNEDVELLFNAISVNVFNNQESPSGNSSSNPNTEEGEERLFLRGQQGYVTVVELFGKEDNQQITEVNGESFLTDGANGVPDELDELRIKKWLINEANLVFYVDQQQVNGGATEPERIIIFDTKNNTVLADYALDLTGNNTDVDAVTEHLGRLERGSDGLGDYYKIKITTHLSNLINKDSSNIPLGVMISQNVTETDFQNLENALLDDEYLSEVPATSVISPEGTVLHGNRSSNLGKRLKLKIYYTEPE